MKYDEWTSLAAMFYESAETGGDKPFLWAKRDGRYQATSWREAAAQVSALSRGLRALGIERGDRVALVSESRPEWPVADIAIMAAGAITVPGYITNTVQNHRHLLADSGAKGAIVSTSKLAARLLPAALDAPALDFVIAMEPLAESGTGKTVHHWPILLEEGRARPDDVAESVAKASRDDIACLIYTSGTGGNPKGVMLSHRSILHNCKGAYRLLERIGLDDEVFLSFLPLSHSYEHTPGQFFPISINAQIYYAEGADQLAANLAEVRPTLMIAVPRLYEVMRQRILTSVKRAGGTKAKLFHKAVELGSRAYEDKHSLGFTGSLYNTVLDKLVRAKVADRFGGRLKAMVSGGAPLNPDVGLFFTALGVRILQGYGQTEAAPVVSCNPPHKVKLHTVGPPLDGVEVKTAADGELLVRGPLVMEGYWENPEATAEALVDGWLHTGDVGEIDADGYIRITDRKKDIIVVSGGDNVSPQRVEGLLTLQSEIAQAMAYGDARPHLVAIVVPDLSAIESFARLHKVEPSLPQLAENAAFVEMISKAVESANLDLSVIERIKRFAIAHDGFTVENGQMTPTLKIRRHRILDVYRDTIEGLY